MGCDIHAFVEYENDYKAWEQLGHFRLARWYDLFAFLGTGGSSRRPDITPVFKPRGLPEHMDIFTRNEYEHRDGDAHHVSWLTLQELRAVKDAYLRWFNEQYPEKVHPHLIDYNAMLSAMQSVEDGFWETRLVFWFDN